MYPPPRKKKGLNSEEASCNAFSSQPCAVKHTELQFQKLVEQFYTKLNLIFWFPPIAICLLVFLRYPKNS